MAPHRLRAASAGSKPAGQVHPLTLEYLRNHGYRVDGLYSKSIDAVRPFQPDIAITVCDNAAREACPVWPETTIRAHWGLSDPSRTEAAVEDTAKAFSITITTIEQRIQRLLKHPFESMGAKQLSAVFSEIGDHN